MATNPPIVPQQFLLAGEMIKPEPESTIKRYERIYDEAKTSAKGVNFRAEMDPILPWESQTEGRFFGSKIEKLHEEIKWLENLIQNTADNTLESLDKTNQCKSEALGALFNVYTQKKLDLHMMDAETEMQKSFKIWVMGEAPAAEYRRCNWISNQEIEFLERLEPELINEKRRVYETNAQVGLSLNNFLHKHKFPITQRMIKSFPGLTRGTIDKTNDLRIKYTAFITMLSKIVPRTEEEAFLYYKYIIVGKDRDKVLTYLDNPELLDWRRFDKTGKPNALPNIPPRLQGPQDLYNHRADIQRQRIYEELRHIRTGTEMQANAIENLRIAQQNAAFAANVAAGEHFVDAIEDNNEDDNEDESDDSENDEFFDADDDNPGTPPPETPALPQLVNSPQTPQTASPTVTPDQGFGVGGNISTPYVPPVQPQPVVQPPVVQQPPPVVQPRRQRRKPLQPSVVVQSAPVVPPVQPIPPIVQAPVQQPVVQPVEQSPPIPPPAPAYRNSANKRPPTPLRTRPKASASPPKTSVSNPQGLTPTEPSAKPAKYGSAQLYELTEKLRRELEVEHSPAKAQTLLRRLESAEKDLKDQREILAKLLADQDKYIQKLEQEINDPEIGDSQKRRALDARGEAKKRLNQLRKEDEEFNERLVLVASRKHKGTPVKKKLNFGE
jgi:hypothetical protein